MKRQGIYAFKNDSNLSPPLKPYRSLRSAISAALLAGDWRHSLWRPIPGRRSKKSW